MANCRMIHRAICTNEQLADCSLLARLLYTWGLPHTSDWGVLSASPRHLKAQVFPLGDETAAEVQAATNELCSAGLWVRFDADGGSYVYYPTFDKYQDLHQRRANTRDGMPLPPGYEGRYRKLPKRSGSSAELPEVPGSSGNTPEVPDSSGEFPRTKGSERNGKEGNEGARASSDAEAEPDPTSGHDHILLSNYPALSQAVREVYGTHWGLRQQQAFVAAAARALELPGCTVTEQEAVEALSGDGKPAPGRRPEWWIGDLCTAKRATKRLLQRQDPAAASDPAIAECIRRHGPKPEDLFDLREWGEWLKGIRAELAGQEAAL
jgi:hypothetical protein